MSKGKRNKNKNKKKHLPNAMLNIFLTLSLHIWKALEGLFQCSNATSSNKMAFSVYAHALKSCLLITWSNSRFSVKYIFHTFRSQIHSAFNMSNHFYLMFRTHF